MVRRPAPADATLPLLPPTKSLRIAARFDPANDVTLHEGDCLDLLRSMPDGCVDLVVTSPPYNLGKPYERKVDLSVYLEQQTRVIAECVRVLAPTGSLCWQVSNYVDDGAIVPLDVALHPAFAAQGLRMRNRIVWHYEHGLHCARRFSHRYEVIAWYTRSDGYAFDLDPVRVPQKYPGKLHYKGDRAGQLSGNPLGKNPGDVWVFPNVKSAHVEKTIHPCQYPVELVERLLLALCPRGGLVLDPFLGAGTTAVAAVRHGRRAAGAEILAEYAAVARERIDLESRGLLRTRPMSREIYRPSPGDPLLDPCRSTSTGRSGSAARNALP
jgi:adenine-specific DNA-methyltransferase